MRLADRMQTGELGVERRDARIHTGQRLAIRLTLPMRRIVVSGIGQCENGVIDRDQSRRQRQLGAEAMQLFKIVQQHQPRVTRAGVAKRFRGDERIAVAIATDPRSDPDQGLQRMIDAE